MPEDTIFDSTDKGTLRPNEDPLRNQGDIFKPMELPNWGWEINLPNNVSPDDPITLFTFTIYYMPEIIDLIVKKTNDLSARALRRFVPSYKSKGVVFNISWRDIYLLCNSYIYNLIYMQ
jgi:hypothetical protein